MNYSVIKATYADLKDLRRLNIDCWNDAYKSIFDSEILNSLDDIITEDGYNKALSAVHNIYIVKVNNQFIGFYSFGSPRQKTIYNEQAVELYAFYLKKEYWSIGLGGSLIKIIEDEMIRLFHPNFIIIWALEANLRAQKFYINNGYQQTTNRKNFSLLEYDYPEKMFIKSLK